MKKFFLLTRGRTGSTAIIDELNKSSDLYTEQELFLIYDSPNPEEIYKLILPYYLWKQKNFYKKWIGNLFSDAFLARLYLKRAEYFGVQQKAEGFGFKVLSHNFDEWSFLSSLLKKRNYRVIYLTRNIAKKVLSGMIANMSGIYNSKKLDKPIGPFEIDLDKFEWLCSQEVIAVEKDYSLLESENFKYISASYEEYIQNRELFFEKIFNFLSISQNLPPKTDYSIIISDPAYTVSNYDTVCKRASSIGMPLNQ